MSLEIRKIGLGWKQIYGNNQPIETAEARYLEQSAHMGACSMRRRPDNQIIKGAHTEKDL